MTQERDQYHYSLFYRDHKGIRRRYAIYAPSLDRFLHVSDQDMWASFETAEILSSKIQTQLCILPPGFVSPPEYKALIDNQNCIYYGIHDKSELGQVYSNILNWRQTPNIIMLYPEDKLQCHDILPDKFNEHPDMFKRLKEYTDYVYPRVAAAAILPQFFNPLYNQRFIEQYGDDGWADTTSNKVDPSNTKNGIEYELKNILYSSNSIDEAEDRIYKFWKKNRLGIKFMIKGYYKLIGAKMPEDLKGLLISDYD